MASYYKFLANKEVLFLKDITTSSDQGQSHIDLGPKPDENQPDQGNLYVDDFDIDNLVVVDGEIKLWHLTFNNALIGNKKMIFFVWPRY